MSTKKPTNYNYDVYWICNKKITTNKFTETLWRQLIDSRKNYQKNNNNKKIGNTHLFAKGCCKRKVVFFKTKQKTNKKSIK